MSTLVSLKTFINSSGEEVKSYQTGSIATVGSVTFPLPQSNWYSKTGQHITGWNAGSLSVSPSTSSRYVRFVIDGSNAVISTSATGITSITAHIYPTWAYDTYTISYNANGGSGAPSAQTKTYGTDLTLSSTVPTKTGYTFKGWATSSTGSVAYAAGGKYSANAAATLYAAWEEKTATLTYNFNGGTAASGQVTSATMKYTTAYSIQSGTPTKTGHSFGGWNTNSSGTGTNYAAGASYKSANTVPSAATLYAKWTANTYTVSYNANSGSGAPSSQTKTYGVSLTLSSTVPIRSGYTFSGWNTSADGSGTAYSSGGSYTANSAATLYAQWSPNPSAITSISDVIAGNSTTIKWTPQHSSFQYKLSFRLGSWSYTTDYISPNRTTEYTYTYTVPMAVCNQLPNTTTGTLIAVLTSYEGTTTISGTNTKTAVLTVPDSIIPTISSVIFSEGTASGFGVYATRLSTVTASITATGSYSSTINSVTMTVDGQTISGSVSNDICTLTSATLRTANPNASLTVYATDSRGRTSVVTTETIAIYEYFTPTASVIDFDISGTSVDLTVAGRIASVNNQNSKYITITRKRLSDNTTTTVQSRTALTDYIFTFTKTETVSDIDVESYLYTVTLEDDKQTQIFTKSTGIVAMSLLAGGNGVAFGKEADTANTFDVNYDSVFRKDVTFEGNVYGLPGSTQSDWNQSDSTASDYIKNKPTIYDAFSNVKVGNTTIAADTGSDTLELEAGSNITLTPDATNDKVTIAATDTTYSSQAAASGGTAVSLCTTGEKYNWGRGINNVTRSGTTFTATRVDGTTFTFTQQDNNTTYSAGTGLSLSSNTFNVDVKTLSAKGHTNYSTEADRTKIPNMNFLSYWNGAYNASNSSNLTYCNQGAFGNVCTKSTNGSTANYLRGDGSWVTPPNTTYSGSGLISVSGTTISTTATKNTVGGRYDNSVWASSASCANATWVQKGSITLAAGWHILSFTVNWAASSAASGAYRSCLHTTSKAENAANGVLFPCTKTATRYMQTIIVHPTASTTYYFNIYQNSGAALNCSVYLNYVSLT